MSMTLVLPAPVGGGDCVVPRIVYYDLVGEVDLPLVGGVAVDCGVESSEVHHCRLLVLGGIGKIRGNGAHNTGSEVGAFANGEGARVRSFDL